MFLSTFRNAVLVGFVAAAAAAVVGGCWSEQRGNTELARMNEPKRSQAIFAAGCFWGVEHTFRQVKGIRKTEVGFIGGTVANPTYRQVCKTDTGHAEAVRVEFDPSIVSYEYLLAVFWGCHDPTTLNRQGPDHGDQYRSAVFVTSKDQAKVVEGLIKTLRKKGYKVVTEVEPAE